jgi:peptide/nickel transport system substrate-binding protein
MNRRTITAALGALALLGAAPSRAETTLRMVMINDLASLDPVQSTAAYVRNHGFLVYDQLYALDSHGEARPEMVESQTVSPDGMTYSFTLRDNLAFSDGSKVRAADAVASIRRWAERDVVGRTLAAATASLDVVDDRTFTLKLAHPFALVTEALARPTANALFVMPERIARTPATTPITDATGSGPFVFQPDQWRAGDKAVYLRNRSYVPRAEPPDGLAGGKVATLDRIEWVSMPDASIAAAALEKGEIDYLEQPSPDLMPQLQRNPSIKTMAVNPVGFNLWLRINQTQPPFDDARARRALLFLVNQHENLDAIGIPPAQQDAYCPAYFLCHTPLETMAGAEGLREIDIPRARALLKEAGYAGQKVVFMDPSDLAINHAVTLTMTENFRKAGLNVDTPAMDWATLTQRRNKREPVDQGGWNLFVTVATVLDTGNPLSNLYLASPCKGGLAGWPCDQALEDLRRSWWEERDPAKRREILDQVQAQAFRSLPYINAGQFRTLTAFRSNIEGIRATTVPVFWGVTKQ